MQLLVLLLLLQLLVLMLLLLLLLLPLVLLPLVLLVLVLLVLVLLVLVLLAFFIIAQNAILLLAGGSRLIRPASVQTPERHLASLQTMEQFDAPGEYRMKLAILLNIKPSMRHSVCSSGNNLISRGLRIVRRFKCKTGSPRQQL